jgi:hypothetical protein
MTFDVLFDESIGPCGDIMPKLSRYGVDSETLGILERLEVPVVMVESLLSRNVEELARDTAIPERVRLCDPKHFPSYSSRLIAIDFSGIGMEGAPVCYRPKIPACSVAARANEGAG